MNSPTRELAGWGNYPRQSCQLLRPERYAALRTAVPHTIARGLGRSYGDAALNEGGNVLLTERLRRLLHFDREQGLVRAEAGLSLDELLKVVVPAGWFPQVTPGTRFVTLGGCIAADVHGKNHHRDGSFAQGVSGFSLIDAAGQQHECSPTQNSELFHASCGGMGLTGLIGEVALQLRPIESAWMEVRHLPCVDLEQTLGMLEDPALDAHYSVAWIDLLARGERMGRGVLMLGEHATREQLGRSEQQAPLKAEADKQKTVPFNMPGWLLNPLSIRAFNQLYYSLQARRQKPFLSHYLPFFYPLDGLAHWNRLYGKRGFLQYQCVIPTAQALSGMTALLEALQQSGHPAFLGVLKRLGEGGEGMLSFPQAGYTLALDLPFSGEPLLKLMNRFDEIVLQHGGRVYLAKDARLAAEHLPVMYPRLAEWQAVRAGLDPEQRFQSSLSRRLRMEGV